MKGENQKQSQRNSAGNYRGKEKVRRCSDKTANREQERERRGKGIERKGRKNEK